MGRVLACQGGKVICEQAVETIAADLYVSATAMIRLAFPA